MLLGLDQPGSFAGKLLVKSSGVGAFEHVQKGGLNPIFGWNGRLQPFPECIHRVAPPLAIVRGQKLGDGPGFARIIARQQFFDERRARLGDLVQGAGSNIPPPIVGVAQLFDQGPHGRRRAKLPHLAQSELLHACVRTLQQTRKDRPIFLRQRMHIEQLQSQAHDFRKFRLLEQGKKLGVFVLM